MHYFAVAFFKIGLIFVIFPPNLSPATLPLNRKVSLLILLSPIKIQGNSKHVIIPRKVVPHLGQISLKILQGNGDCILLVISLNPYSGVKYY